MSNSIYPVTNPHFYVLGYGRFGRLALDRLKRKFPSATFSVADRRREVVAQIRDKSVEVLSMGGILKLMVVFPGMAPEEWIIPAVPVHVAYEWLKQHLRESYHIETLDVPDEIVVQLPNPVMGENKALFVSIADFICPDDCPEPEDLCTHTRQPRPMVLNEALAGLKHPLIKPVVITSHQLAPGVGGYRASDLKAVLDETTNHAGSILLATACKCHGVAHAFNLNPFDELTNTVKVLNSNDR